MTHLFRPAMTICLAIWIAACDLPVPEQVECVCKCETECSWPEENKAARQGKSRVRDPLGEQDKRRRAKAAREKKRSEDATPKRTKGDKANAASAGVVTTEPGSGRTTTLTDAEREAMRATFSEFLAEAKKRNIEGMKKWTTQRLATSLTQSLPRYEDRLFSSLRETISALPSGLELGEARDVSEGNIEILLRFGNGHERRPVFFKENEQWRLNRL